MKKTILLSSIILLCTLVGFSQSPVNKDRRNRTIDSLWQIFNDAKNDTTRINIYIDLSNLYRKSNLDSALYFGNMGMELALKTLWYKGLAQCYNKIGNIYTEQGEYDKALYAYLQSLSIAEKHSDSNRMSVCYTNIGIIHSYQGNFDKAIEYYYKSLEIDKKLGNKKGIASCYNQIGNGYKNYGSSLNNSKVKSEKFDKAIEYFEKSLKIFEELGDKNGVSYCYNNMGGVFFSQGNSTSVIKIRAGYYNKTLDCFLKSLKIFKELGNKNNIAAVESNIAGLYCTIADSTKTKLYYYEAIKYGLEAIQIAKEIKALSTENIAARVLLKAYKGIDNTTKSLNFAEIVIATKDSIFKIEKTKAIAEMEAKYQTEKKNKEIQFQQLLIHKKNYQFYSLIAITLLIMVIAVLIVWQNKIRNNQKNVELKQKLLRSQMNPHFLFNSLISIQNFMFENNTDDAAIYLSKFANLMRQILDNSQEEYIPLSEEKSLLENYLQLQKLRYENKFDYFIEIDPTIDLEFTTIPPMLAQPFIENSIEHGFSGKQSAGIIIIRFLKASGSILFEVEDNGIGILQAGKNVAECPILHKSLATNITKERVHYLNKGKRNKVKFTIVDLSVLTNGQQSGTKVSFTIPFQNIKS